MKLTLNTQILQAHKQFLQAYRSRYQLTKNDLCEALVVFALERKEKLIFAPARKNAASFYKLNLEQPIYLEVIDFIRKRDIPQFQFFIAVINLAIELEQEFQTTVQKMEPKRKVTLNINLYPKTEKWLNHTQETFGLKKVDFYEQVILFAKSNEISFQQFLERGD